LQLKYDELLSSFAFKFNLRHYTQAERAATSSTGSRAEARDASPSPSPSRALAEELKRVHTALLRALLKGMVKVG
jgi:hypothetical protein